jgi:hypothetical protein
VLFFAPYATFAELEETVTLKATQRDGHPVDLRLWIVGRDGVAWVTMPRAKTDAHGLTETRAELLRRGEWRCVVAMRDERRETVNAIHRLRHEKYAVQRFATVIGMFRETAGESTVALRLDPCPEPGRSQGVPPPRPSTADAARDRPQPTFISMKQSLLPSRSRTYAP